jgi:hypothetical protein
MIKIQSIGTLSDRKQQEIMTSLIKSKYSIIILKWLKISIINYNIQMR